MHYVALIRPPSAFDQGALHESLTYSNQIVKDGAEDDGTVTTLFVYPRISTIPPRSSKATSTAKTCDFEQVKRIKRHTITKIRSKQELDKDLAMRTSHDPIIQMKSQSTPDLQSMLA